MSDAHEISDIQIIRTYLVEGTNMLRKAQVNMDRHNDKRGISDLDTVFKVLAELERQYRREDFIRCRDWANGVERYHVGRIEGAEELRGTLDLDEKPMIMLTIDWLAPVQGASGLLYAQERRLHLLSKLAEEDEDGESFFVDVWREQRHDEKAIA